MVDLNEWHLTYGDTDLEFGTHESGYPLTKQVDISEPTLDPGDIAHPLTDGIVFGRDLTRGRKITFAGAHLEAGVAMTSPPWDGRLDASGVIEAAWAAESLRHQVEVVAKLTNADRARSVYGRPRNYRANLDRARQGWTEWSAEFHTTDDRFYGAGHTVTVSSAQLVTYDPSDPNGTGTLPTPTHDVPNAGTRNAFPRVVFQSGPPGFVGPLEDARMFAFDADDELLWWVGIAGSLGTFHLPKNPAVTTRDGIIDARPWALSVIASEGHRPGSFRGARISDMILPPGTSQLAFGASGGGGTMTVTWDDTYGSL